MMKDGACNRKNYMNNCNQTSYVYTYTHTPPLPLFFENDICNELENIHNSL